MDIEKLILNGKVEVDGYEIKAKEIKAKLATKRGQLHIDLKPNLPISNGLANFFGSNIDKIVLSEKKAYIIVDRGPDQTIEIGTDMSPFFSIFGDGYETDQFSLKAGETDVHILKSGGGVKIQFLTSVRIFTKKILGIRVKKTIILYSVDLTEDAVVVNTSCGEFELNRSDCGLV